MTIPTYEAFMLPVLRCSAERTWVVRSLIDHLADQLYISEADRAARLPSGTTTLASRVGWAKTYLKQAGLVEMPKRGEVRATAAGRELLKSNPANLAVKDLRRFPAFLQFLGKTRQTNGAEEVVESISIDSPLATPEEQIVAAYSALDQSVRDALLARVLEATPSFFERVILDLLLAMGYGGSRREAARQLGGTGDGGVDGVINEDQLGLDRIYLQAKRYQPGNTIGSEVVQAFMGALLGKGAQKGVLITTSSFSRAALQVATNSQTLRIVLIDGDTLASHMIAFGVGVRVARTVEIKKVDLDYFDETETE